jgi:hypothetical protein
MMNDDVIVVDPPRYGYANAFGIVHGGMVIYDSTIA